MAVAFDQLCKAVGESAFCLCCLVEENVAQPIIQKVEDDEMDLGQLPKGCCCLQDLDWTRSLSIPFFQLLQVPNLELECATSA